MKIFRFPCCEEIDTIDAFIEHLEITAYGLHIQNRNISLPIDWRDGILSIGIDGRSHYGGYTFIAKPRLENGAILIEGTIEKEVLPEPYDSRAQKIFFTVMRTILTALFCLPLLAAAVIRAITRRKRLKKLFLACGSTPVR